VKKGRLVSRKISWLLLLGLLGFIVTTAANALEIPDGLEANFILLLITLLDSLSAGLVTNRCNFGCGRVRLQGTVANVVKMVDHFFFLNGTFGCFKCLRHYMWRFFAILH